MEKARKFLLELWSEESFKQSSVSTNLSSNCTNRLPTLSVYAQAAAEEEEEEDEGPSNWEDDPRGDIHIIAVRIFF